MNQYNSLALIYDLVLGDRTDEVEFLRKKIRKYAPEAQNVLEIACGTGAILKELSGQYKVTGIDISVEMIKEATKNVPAGTFFVDDMTNFNLDKKFDAVISMYDSINHLESKEGWQKCFENVAHHLKPNGVFIFDILTTGRFQELPEETPVEESGVTIDAELIDPQTLKWSITHKDDLIEMQEIVYPISEIKEMLQKYFDSIEITDIHENPATDTSPRAYFICSNPK